MLIAYLIIALIFVSSAAWYRLIRKPSEVSLTHRVPRGPAPKPFLAVIVTLLLIMLGLSTLFSKPPSVQHVDLRTLAAANLQSALVAIVLLGLMKISIDRFVRIEEYGIKEEKFSSQLKDGLLGFLLAIIPVTLFRTFTLPFLNEDELHPLIRLIKDSGDITLWAHVIFAAVIIAPILEELMYRVILQGWLRTFLSPVPAILVTALIFSSMHGFPAVIALFPLAIILGYIYEVRHSYFACVTTHMLFNGVNLLMILISPDQPVAPGN
jgi:membrane protease YdiL (CAAX protease family)